MVALKIGTGRQWERGNRQTEKELEKKWKKEETAKKGKTERKVGIKGAIEGEKIEGDWGAGNKSVRRETERGERERECKRGRERESVREREREREQWEEREREGECKRERERERERERGRV